MYHRYDILKYLPKEVTIQTTPDGHIAWSWGEPKEINVKKYTLKTSDLVSAFYSLERDAIRELQTQYKNETELKEKLKNIEVQNRIKQMSYF